MQHGHVLKKVNFDLWTLSAGVWREMYGGGSAGNMFASMFLHSGFPLV